jgi:hypothetical protein
MDTPVIIIIYTLSLCNHLYGISIGMEGRVCYWRRIDGVEWLFAVWLQTMYTLSLSFTHRYP